MTRRSALLWAALAAGVPALAWQHKQAPYAVIVGTVFQESGFSFQGVSVTLSVKGATAGSKKQNGTTNFRGEFSFRVPPEPATYVVTASKRGFAPASVEASVPGEGRVDVTITLAAESKK